MKYVYKDKYEAKTVTIINIAVKENNIPGKSHSY